MNKFPSTRNLVVLAMILTSAAVIVLIFYNDNPSVFQDTKIRNNSKTIIKSGYVKEYSLEKDTWPNGILVDSEGQVWVAGSKTYSLYKFDPFTDQTNTFKIKEPDGVTQDRPLMVWAMLEDSNSTIWLSQFGTRSILLFDKNTKKFDEINGLSHAPFQMKHDINENVWFTTTSTVGVVQKTPNFNTPYKISEFQIGNNTHPTGLYLNGDAVWITDAVSQKIVQYKMVREDDHITNIVKILELPLQNNTAFSYPTDIFVSGNNIWFTEHETNFITKYDVKTRTITRFPTSQSEYGVSTLPFWMRAVDNGSKIWFNEHEGNKIGLLDTSAKTLTEYEIPSRPSDGYVVYPLNIAIDPHNSNHLWFTELNTDKFGVIDANIPIPFSIQANTSKIMLKNSSTSNIDITLSKHKSLDTVRLFLNASSSLDQAGGLFKIDSRFSKEYVDLNNDDEHVQLHLRSLDTPSGNFTLGISASDGIVTKTIFVDLTIPN
ncbi:MAG TPA: hypothetical protein VFA69_06380 [Candidatus Nitrosotalea sp.]|nr:hypothetical protein [Candidatus Nitrosotalea sp.]